MTAVLASAIKQGCYHHIKAEYEAVDDKKPRFKVGYITLPATVDDGDTVAIEMYEKFGIRKFMGAVGMIHTTTDSVIVEEAPTTAVEGVTLTLTVGGSTDNKKRFYAIYGI